MLVVNSKVPAKSVQELIALAKAEPGKLNYGSYGVGTYAHLSMEDFKQRTGTDIVHIPYRGAAPAAQALLAGDVNMLLLNYSSIADHEKDGKVRILAAAGDQRAPRSGPTCRRLPKPAYRASRPPSGSRCSAPPTCRAELVNEIHADVGKVLDSAADQGVLRQAKFRAGDRLAG